MVVLGRTGATPRFFTTRRDLRLSPGTEESADRFQGLDLVASVGGVRGDPPVVTAVKRHEKRCGMKLKYGDICETYGEIW